MAISFHLMSSKAMLYIPTHTMGMRDGRINLKPFQVKLFKSVSLQQIGDNLKASIIFKEKGIFTMYCIC